MYIYIYIYIYICIYIYIYTYIQSPLGITLLNRSATPDPRIRKFDPRRFTSSRGDFPPDRGESRHISTWDSPWSGFVLRGLAAFKRSAFREASTVPSQFAYEGRLLKEPS